MAPNALLCCLSLFLRPRCPALRSCPAFPDCLVASLKPTSTVISGVFLVVLVKGLVSPPREEKLVMFFL